jgi:hypothetical protein
MALSGSQRRTHYRIPPPNNRHYYKRRTLQHQSSSNQEWWRQILGSLSGLLILVGVLVYGCLSMIYWSFYGPLGIDPSDVGLNYANVLSRAAALIFVPFIAVVYVGLLVGLVRIIPPATEATVKLLRVRRKPFRTAATRRITPRADWSIPKWAMGAVGIAIALLLTVLFIMQIIQASFLAASVRSGKPIRDSYVGWMQPALFSIRADPVTVSSNGTADEAPIVEKLSKRTDLLYLGQANGTLVLYDPRQEIAFYLPANTAVLTVNHGRH